MTALDSLFLAAGVGLILVSRKSLLRPDTHGFYRLFVFLAVLLLVWLNLSVWSENPESLAQRLSSLLQFGSLYLLLHSLYLLVVRGGHSHKRKDAANLAFENTARLVDRGLYRFIRHPMYGSLLLLMWGIVLKGPSSAVLLVAAIGTAALVAAAKVEEGENIRAFGQAYRDYIQRTRMFVPFLL